MDHTEGSECFEKFESSKSVLLEDSEVLAYIDEQGQEYTIYNVTNMNI